MASYIFWQQIFDALISEHRYYSKSSLNIILDNICLKCECLLYVYDFIIVHNFAKSIEVVVLFGGEIYTSIVQ